MSILDDAIREHLELKRQHGAPVDEVKKLEDEAFGPPARPDDSVDPLAEAPTEFMLTPESEAAVASEADEQEAEGRRVPDIADLQEAPPAAAEPAPTDEELLASELEEPRLGAEPAAPADAPAPAFDEEDDFFDEQRLSDELDQALEAPAPEPEPTEEQPLAAFPPTEEAEAVELEEDEPVSDEHEQPSEERAFFDDEAEEESSAEHEVVPEPAREQGHEDVLEETPDFLEEAPEDDQLWFEQKSPKDFDFGD